VVSLVANNPINVKEGEEEDGCFVTHIHVFKNK